jgi:hypothetical protein
MSNLNIFIDFLKQEKAYDKFVADLAKYGKTDKKTIEKLAKAYPSHTSQLITYAFSWSSTGKNTSLWPNLHNKCQLYFRNQTPPEYMELKGILVPREQDEEDEDDCDYIEEEDDN